MRVQIKNADHGKDNVYSSPGSFSISLIHYGRQIQSCTRGLPCVSVPTLQRRIIAVFKIRNLWPTCD